MKAIIEGRRYNTEAKHTVEVASAESGHYTTDFHYWAESLYRTNHGNWFLAGEGGALSRYGVSRGNEGGGGHRIIPMTPAEALRWLEEQGELEAIEKYFASEVEDA